MRRDIAAHLAGLSPERRVSEFAKLSGLTPAAARQQLGMSALPAVSVRAGLMEALANVPEKNRVAELMRNGRIGRPAAELMLRQLGHLIPRRKK